MKTFLSEAGVFGNKKAHFTFCSFLYERERKHLCSVKLCMVSNEDLSEAGWKKWKTIKNTSVVSFG